MCPTQRRNEVLLFGMMFCGARSGRGLPVLAAKALLPTQWQFRPGLLYLRLTTFSHAADKTLKLSTLCYAYAAPRQPLMLSDYTLMYAHIGRLAIPHISNVWFICT